MTANNMYSLYHQFYKGEGKECIFAYTERAVAGLQAATGYKL